MSSSQATGRLRGGIRGRVVLALVAVVVLAWLVVMERDTRLQAQALKTPARAEPDLRHATFLNPDTSPTLLRALIYLGEHDRRRALATVESVLRREPDNSDAWGELLLIARGYDASALRRAQAAARRLDPIGARGLGGG
jgi:hypothetical protein